MEYLIYKVTVTRKELLGSIIAFVGVLLTSNGPMIMKWINGEDFTSDFKNYKTDSNLVRFLVTIFLIVITIAQAYSVLIVRKIDKSKISHYELNLHFGYVSIFMSGIFYQFSPDNAFNFDFIFFIKCLVYSGLIMALAQAFFMQALYITKNFGIVMMVGFIGLLYSYFLSVFRYGESLNMICIIGTVMVIYGVSRIVLK